MRNFSTLTQGDIISIRYNDKIYELLVMETKPSSSPGKGISIIETDLEVDFAPPVGYEEPQRPKPQEKSIVSWKFIDSLEVVLNPVVDCRQTLSLWDQIKLAPRQRIPVGPPSRALDID
jgi:hypothetical protein